MDFDLSAEQQMLLGSAQRYLTEVNKDRTGTASQGLGREDRWSDFAEMGWLALAVPEDFGGIGTSLIDLAILCEEFGRERCAEPFIHCALLPAHIAARVEAPWRMTLLADIASGSRRVAVALLENGQRYGTSGMCVQAAPQSDGSYRLRGTKVLVAGGAESGWLIVSAQVPAQNQQPATQALVLIESDAPGTTCCAYRAIDGSSMADFAFDNVAVPAARLYPLPERGKSIVEAVLDEATVCLCADLIGGMEKVLQLTVAYLVQRRQFGKPLSEFQVLQHQMAEMFIEAQEARSLLYRTLAALEDPSVNHRQAVSGCAIKVMRTAKVVAASGIHLHGGIGVSSEYPVGHYLQRALVAERSFGDEEFHLQRYLGSASR